MAGKGGLDAGGVRCGEPVGDASEHRFVDVGWGVEKFDPDRQAGIVNVYPGERVDYLDGPSNRSALKRNVRGVCFGVVPDDHNVRLPFLVSIGDGDNDVRLGSWDNNFQTAACFGGAKNGQAVVSVGRRIGGFGFFQGFGDLLQCDPPGGHLLEGMVRQVQILGPH